MGGWLDFAAERLPEVWLRTGEHMILAGASTLAAVLIGVPLGIAAARSARARGPLLAAVGIVQTVPSLAMLVLLLALFDRIGVVPAMAALVLYALLPIVRNTVTALEDVPAEVDEAARGLGLSPRQQLLWVRLPLSAPVIVAGIRTAAVIGVGIATLSAFIGAGGLGEFINRGLALADTDLILLGAIPAALLALVVDASLAATHWSLAYASRVPSTERRGWHRWARPAALAAPLALPLLALGAVRPPGGPAGADHVVVVGSKNFTEQLIVAELMARVIEERTGLRVERRFNLGGTMICHEALTRGELDLYAEYSGTALTAILGDDGSDLRSTAARARLHDVYRTRFALSWLPPFGFDNTYVLAVSGRLAEARGWTRASQLGGVARELRVGMTAEFAERADGYPGFRRAYGIEFGQTRSMDPGLMYEAVARGEVDAIFAFATDGRLAAHRLTVLEDDRAFFPPYEAAPVVRRTTLERVPGLESALAALAGQLPDSAMRRLNRQVDVDGEEPADVAARFLERRGIIGSRSSPMDALAFASLTSRRTP